MFEYLAFEKLKNAIAISLFLPENSKTDSKDSFEELILLARTLNLKVIDHFTQKRNSIEPDYYIGKGKLEEIKQFIDINNIDVVLFDNELSGIQQRNLEKYLNKLIVGRTEIILNIFHKRAKTNEAKLQVQLAYLEYMLPRLRHRWSHFSRVEGGIGMRGGEGEKQIELDRRMIKEQIDKIKQKLKKVDVQMKTRRKNRIDKNVVSIVGYTNAGKSTLFNAMAKTNAYTENMLFSTLDSTVKKAYINENLIILLNDTVGFINRLPHLLVASFKSTLDEILNSKLIIHVMDISNPALKNNMKSVNSILEEIGANEIPVIRVFNKCDLIDNSFLENLCEDKTENDVYISAIKKEGLDKLKERILFFFNMH